MNIAAARRFYLTGDMTNLCPFIQGSLEWPFSELFSANVSLWNKYKIIAFNIFSCISNEITIELTIYGILCRNVTIFYRQVLASLFQVQEILKACRSSKLNFSSSCFIIDDSYLVIIVWLHVIVFSEQNILHFWDNVNFFLILSSKSSSKLVWFFQLLKSNPHTSFQIFVSTT